MSAQSADEDAMKKYAGFSSPNYTQTPNDLFDELMRHIEDLSELKVTLAMVRQTFGFHRAQAEMSLSFLVKKTGMTEKAVRRGIKLALERGTIRVVSAYTPVKGTVYETVVLERGSSETPPPEPPRNKVLKRKVPANNQKTIVREVYSSKSLEEHYPPISGSSDVKLDEDEDIPDSFEDQIEALDHQKKETVFKTPATKYLAEQRIGKWKNRWKGFKNKKEAREWAEIEDSYIWKTLKEKIDYFVSIGIPSKKIVPNVIKSLKDNVKPDKVKHEVVRAKDGGYYI